MSKRFEINCQEAAKKVDVSVYFIEDSRPADAYEDDGTLHVVWRGTRAMFDVSRGQSSDGVAQNVRTRIILREMNMAKRITDRVLVEEWSEDDNEDESCPHCGR